MPWNQSKINPISSESVSVFWLLPFIIARFAFISKLSMNGATYGHRMVVFLNFCINSTCFLVVKTNVAAATTDVAAFGGDCDCAGAGLAVNSGPDCASTFGNGCHETC